MRFLLLLAALSLLAAGAYLASIYATIPYAAVARLGQISYFEYAPDGLQRLALALTPARYAAYRAGLGALLAASGLGNLGLLRRRAFRRELRRLGAETRRAAAALARTWQRRSGVERASAGALLLAILAVRGVWLLLDPLSPDELNSYDAFVHHGAVAVTSFYPIPNNHVGYNALCAALARVVPGHDVLIMRGPALLVATAGTALSYALLTHFRNFWVATAVTALFDLTPLTVIYAATGRGYGLQLLCVQSALFAVVGLATGRGYRRLGWAVLVGSGVVGLYAVPTHALPLGALLLLLVAAGSTARRGHRRHTATAAALIGATTAVLYAPVGCVSGWDRLLANRYLAPHTLATFWRGTPAYLYETSALLLGPVRPGLLAAAALLLVTPVVLARRAGPDRSRGQGLAWAGWALLAGPVVFMLAGRLFIPGRALLFVPYAGFLLAALGADAVRARVRYGRAAGALTAILAATVLWRVSGLVSQAPVLLRSQALTATAMRACHWLRAQPPGPVFIHASYHEMLFYHDALLRHQPLALHSAWRAGARYSYVVWAAGQATDRPAWARDLPYRVGYHDELVTVYALPQPASAPPAAPVRRTPAAR